MKPWAARMGQLSSEKRAPGVYWVGVSVMTETSKLKSRVGPGRMGTAMVPLRLSLEMTLPLVVLVRSGRKRRASEHLCVVLVGRRLRIQGV